MFEIDVLNKKNNKRFVKKFNDSISAWQFVRKVKFSKDLELVCIIDNSYLFD